MTYEEAIDYIGSISSFGIKLGMERIVSLLSHLDDPQKFLKVIHVAGDERQRFFWHFFYQKFLWHQDIRLDDIYRQPYMTIESVSRLTDSIFQKKQWPVILKKIREICLQMTAGGEEHPTVFEVETAMALMYFWIWTVIMLCWK